MSSNSPSTSTRLMLSDRNDTIQQKRLLITKTIKEMSLRRDKHKKILIKLKRINNPRY